MCNRQKLIDTSIILAYNLIDLVILDHYQKDINASYYKRLNISPQIGSGETGL